jgi:plasmid stability protein
MPDITVPDVPADDVAALRARAERHGRPFDAELRLLLRQAALEESLLSGLDRATEAVDERLERTGDALGTGTRTGRRYRSVEPTRRR